MIFCAKRASRYHDKMLVIQKEPAKIRIILDSLSIDPLPYKRFHGREKIESAFRFPDFYSGNLRTFSHKKISSPFEFRDHRIDVVRWCRDCNRRGSLGDRCRIGSYLTLNFCGSFGNLIRCTEVADP